MVVPVIYTVAGFRSSRVLVAMGELVEVIPSHWPHWALVSMLQKEGP